MGTTGMGALVPKIECFPKDMEGQRIAVDTYNLLYAYHATSRDENGDAITNSNGIPIGHLEGLLIRHQYYLRNGIRPVYVFDPETPNPLKAKELAKRADRREEAEAKLQAALDAGDHHAAKKAKLQTISLTKPMIHDARRLITALGAPIIDAVAEGEAEAARLVKTQACHAVATQDYDALLFGTPLIIRDFTGSKMGRLALLHNVLRHNGVTLPQFVDAAILTGTDFNEGVFRVGVKSALKLIREHGSLEAIVNAGADPKAKKTEQNIAAWYDEDRLDVLRQFYANPPVGTEEPHAPHGLQDNFVDLAEGEFGLNLNRFADIGAIDSEPAIPVTAQQRLL